MLIGINYIMVLMAKLLDRLPMFHYIIIVGIFFVFPITASCNSIDSLLALAENEQAPELLIKIYDELSWKFRHKDPTLSKLYAQKELKLALAILDTEAEVNAYNRLGLYFSTVGRFDSSLFYYRQAEEIELKEQNCY